MPIETEAGGAANLANTNSATRRQLTEAAALLEFADLFRGQGTIVRFEDVRIDVQGVWSAGPGRNIQAQVRNGSIAALRIADELGDADTAQDRAAVVTAAQQALLASCANGLWMEVTGTAP